MIGQVFSKHSLYPTWRGMLARCENPNHDSFERYGGRGIKVCERWASSFENFLADMGEKPSKSSIDRIDVDGHYTPENCRWVTKKEQMRNTRANRYITVNGVTKLLVEWSEQTGLSQQVIKRRIDTYKWTPEEAINTPINGRKSGQGSKNSRAKLDESMVCSIKRMLSQGETVSNLSKLFGVSYNAIYNIKSGVRWAHVEVTV